MSHDHLHRLLQLAKKTGDTLIVTDPDGHEPVVIMDVAKYEALLDLGTLAQDSEETYEDMPFEDLYGEEELDDDLFLPEIEQALPVDANDLFVPEEVTREASVIDEGEPDPDNEDEDGEERFYLEPIE